MRNMKKTVCLLTLLLPLAQQAWPADDLMTSQLVDEARAWQQKDRDDLAADVLRKLLRISPNHPEALIRLGGIEARSGNLKEADVLYARAARLSPAPRGLHDLQALIAEKKGAPVARKPADVPRVAEAPRAESAKPSTPPAAPAKTDTDKPRLKLEAEPPRLAAAQQSASAAKQDDRTVKTITTKPEKEKTEKPEKVEKNDKAEKTEKAEPVIPATADWAETRLLLEERARKHPGDANTLFALAKHLAQREATRREALRQLAYLAGQKNAPRDVKASWRQALLALESHAGDAPLYSAYLQAHPDDAVVAARLRGLPSDPAFAASPASGLAAPMAQNVAVPAEASFEGGNKAKAAALLRQALDDEQRGTYRNAVSKLENALLLDPAMPAIRLSLARQYERLGAYDNAGSLLDDMLAINPGNPDALYARARIFGAQQRYDDAMVAFERIPQNVRTVEMAQEQRRIWLTIQLARAKDQYRRGDVRQAQATMERLEPAARGNDQMMALVAAGWNDAGQPAQGLRLMRDILSRSPVQTASTRIRYAELLLNNFQDAELSAVLRDLSAPGKLNRQQQDEVNGIILSYSIRLAETMRESGQYGQATAILAPIMQRSDDIRVLVAMARIHRSAAEPAQALAVIEQAIERQPRDLEQRLIAVDSALAARDNDKADQHAKAALDIAPRHPRALAAAGRVEKALGNVDKAIDLFRRAHAAEQNADSFTGVPPHMQLRLVSNAVEVSPASRAPAPGGPNLLPIPDLGPASGRPAPGLLTIPNAVAPPAETAPAPAYDLPAQQVKPPAKPKMPTSVSVPDKPVAKEELPRGRNDSVRPAAPAPFAVPPANPRIQASAGGHEMHPAQPMQQVSFDYRMPAASAPAPLQSAEDDGLKLRMTMTLRPPGGRKTWRS
ncbi:tetratricopeptide repeat protein [Noviherbaspirillum galbum]|uniref:Tetratricopeptide repeat protein n=1 Tax=Noviherbaspirillum galbum TaxID=2709383 RepID=A0A6B3SH87_9BURK|nr:tetratricopeptide repeat protein [Noviherbaspirillum galbum]NEX60028.1 tetratricopeptide repeat protein [Noviherbaspirillum galbum]